MIPSAGKDSDSSDSRKTFIILIFLTCSVDCFGFLFLFFAFPHSVVHVDFIGTKKSNYAFDLFFFPFLLFSPPLL